MKYQRHWATSTVLPDGDVLVTGGGRENNGNGGYVTNAEIWDPETGDWTEVDVPYEHARLYHSAALLLPDGRVMIGGGGAPGPRNYTDVEYYSPSYLFDGNAPAVRPEITSAPAKIGYDGDFQITASGAVSRVTLVRNGSVTHGFNNDQNFQDLAFTQSGGTVTITAPVDGTYAPARRLHAVRLRRRRHAVGRQDRGHRPRGEDGLAHPAGRRPVRVPAAARRLARRQPRRPSSTSPPGNGRMTPWTVESQVQLVRGTAAGQGGLGSTGYHLGLGSSGSLERTLTGLDPGRDYRISLRYARDSRSAGTDAATTALSVGDLSTTLTAAPGPVVADTPSARTSAPSRPRRASRRSACRAPAPPA